MNDCTFNLFSDTYMKRYYNLLIGGDLPIDGTIFLGDLFDGVTQIMFQKTRR